MTKKKTSNAKFSLIRKNGKVEINIEGTKKHLVELVAFTLHEYPKLLDVLMDASLEAVLGHIQKEHGVNIKELIKQALSEVDEEYPQRPRSMRPKKRSVN